MENPYIEIGGRRIGPGFPPYIVAEMSANHARSFDQAAAIIRAARKAGADAVKIQTYTPDTLTIDCDKDYFRIQGTPWHGKMLYHLYGEAFMPWEWQPMLMEAARELRLDFFSTAFDETSVDFLESINVPAYKVASFECTDVPLLKRIARTRKPVIVSTGMATLAEIDEAVRIVRVEGGAPLALLKCTSAYPAPAEEMNLRTIPHLMETFGVPVGLSDHTLDVAVPVAAVTLGACIIEKHLTLSRSNPGPDSAFSLEPSEFAQMAEAARTAHKALGAVWYGVSEAESASSPFRRSLFVVKEMKKGEMFTSAHVRSIRPGFGLHTRYLEDVLGRHASRDIERGTPLTWDLVGGPGKE